ncbi:DUF1570 domain-containing protein [Stratiformator vulcanicus]|uniref:DUF1570 domain-containing protein n=1 Tax=Stratiformator vulcanicus TaxID=2527980 RepID=A0A517R4R7_9PLAN|nr:DUF1570 domain-containing protein [Stratiformator vulcanicus]QDT38850.1 hypothetical protein Pan189_32490 [Stratiformator vulcanicus]
MKLRHSVGVVAALTLVFGISASTEAQFSSSIDERRLESLRQRYTQEQDRLVLKLETIAVSRESAGDFDSARQIRDLAVPPDRRVITVRKLPETLRPEIPLSLQPDERAWRLKLRQTLDDYSLDLYRLSRQAVGLSQASLAFELLRQSAHYNPDNVAARKLLGYVRGGDGWVRPYESIKRRRGEVDHATFGWIPASHVERYENGERYFRGTWISADREREIRRDFKNAWSAETEHYIVKTNHSLERGVEIARALETFHSAFFQVFAAFFESPDEMQRLFNTSSRARTSDDRYVVHFYADKDQYVDALIRKMPQIAITNGFYYPADRVAYFYHSDDPANLETVFHEATHQLMYEALPFDRAIATRAHFWVVEGIACYMESFRVEDGRGSLGRPDHVRFRAARFRLDHDEYYVPLAAFSSMGMAEFQTSRNIKQNYSQAAGLAHFFMHFDDGSYRDALIEYLSDIHAGDQGRRRAVRNLAALTGVAYQTLDKQYKQYIAGLGEVPRAEAAQPRRVLINPQR